MSTLNIPIPAGATSVSLAFAVPAPVAPAPPLPGYNLPLSLDPAGWTVPGAAERVVYCSASGGSDGNAGASPLTPVATAAKGWSMLRDGHADALLFKCGDVWATSPAPNGANLSGYGKGSPLMLGNYGSGARPLFRTGKANGFARVGASPPSVSHLLVSGLDFYCDVRDPQSPTYDATVQDPQGIYWMTDGTDLTFEDCRFRFYVFNLDFTTKQGGNLSDIRVRRCQVLDAYAVSPPQFAQGIFMANASQVLIEDNVFDHNGWNESIATAARTKFCHNLYTDYLVNATFRGNLITRAANFGIKCNGDAGQTIYSSSLIQANLFLGNGNDVVYGMNNVADYLAVNAAILGNVFTETGGTLQTEAQSSGVTLGSVNGAQISGNYFINKAPLGPGPELILQAHAQQNVNFTGNVIHGWGGEGIVNNNTRGTVPDVVLAPNDISATAWARSAETYDASLGGPGTVADMLARARGLSKANWDQRLLGAAVAGYVAGK